MKCGPSRRSKRLLRLRIWFTVLMGPITNILLIGVAVAFWDFLARFVNPNIVILWIILNALIAFTNLLPHRYRRLGQLHRSDGMQLLQIPLKTNADLAVYLYATPLLSALELFKESDYIAARETCLNGLKRLPDNPWLNVMLSACQINMGEYNSARAVLEPLLISSTTQAPEIRAAVHNNLALAVWLCDINSALCEQSTPRAESLSRHAYEMYPCVLPYRSTRAMLLVATFRPTEALALLEYSNYERGSSSDRGDQQIARAYALRQLSRNEEADQALNMAMELNNRRRPWLTTLGLMPASPATFAPAP